MRGFLHHVAQLAGQDQVALARHHLRLDMENFAAYLGPRQTVRDSDLVRTLALVRDELGWSQQPGKVLRGHGRAAGLGFAATRGRSSAFHQTARHFARKLRHLPLQLAQPGLARVFGYDLAQRRPPQRKLALGQAGFGDLLGHQELLGNGQLLFLAVAGQAQGFHPIPQGRRNGVSQIGGADEHDLG